MTVTGKTMKENLKDVKFNVNQNNMKIFEADLLEIEKAPHASSILPDSRLNRPLNDEGCMPAGRSRLKLGEIK